MFKCSVKEYRRTKSIENETTLRRRFKRGCFILAEWINIWPIWKEHSIGTRRTQEKSINTDLVDLWFIFTSFFVCCVGIRLITSSLLLPIKIAYKRIYLLWLCASPNKYSISKQNHTIFWSKNFGSCIKRRKLTKKTTGGNATN